METSQNYNESVEDILQESLTQAFSPPPAQEEPTAPVNESFSSFSSAVVTPAESVHETTPDASEHFSEDSWKSEYESHVATWRTQSAEAREKAEKERQRWEELRAAEKVKTERLVAEGVINHSTSESFHPESEWETVSNANTNPVTESAIISEAVSPSLMGARDLPEENSESQVNAPPDTDATASVPAELAGTRAPPADELQKWESVPPSETSFPSISYPSLMETPPSLSRPPPEQPPAPLNATLAVFDTSLSTRTRVKALFSSLAINMLLPFINGVMLGFGEIFAKNVVLGWFGWKPQAPGSIAASTGIGAGPRNPWGQRQEQRQS